MKNLNSKNEFPLHIKLTRPLVKINIKYEVNKALWNFLEGNFDTFCFNFQPKLYYTEISQETLDSHSYFNIKVIPIEENIQLVKEVEERLEIGL